MKRTVQIVRSSTRPSFFALVIGLWIISCAIVLASVLVAPPARGQAPETGEWSPTEVRPLESAGEVVLKFTRYQPGRTVYYTSDGDDCSTVYPTPDCRRPLARAGEDYGAVRGEWIFTEAGSRTITIPIIDDDLDEADEETFGINASQHGEDVAGTSWYGRAIRIKDDDPKDDADAPSAGTAPNATTARGRSPSSSNAKAISGSDDGDAEVQPGSGSELASGELEPGPGFEPVIERDSEPASERDGRSGDSASWLAFGLGTIALGSGGVVWVRRRRRWSPTRS